MREAFWFCFNHSTDEYLAIEKKAHIFFRRVASQFSENALKVENMSFKCKEITENSEKTCRRLRKWRLYYSVQRLFEVNLSEKGFWHHSSAFLLKFDQVSLFSYMYVANAQHILNGNGMFLASLYITRTFYVHWI